ncbi:MAG: hemerythrin family protein [Rhodospirillales bacterium]|nr:hemerythrin family protein [Rhodospirillales bacterium]
MPIEWRSTLAIGHEEIDADHQKLIRLVNLYEDAVAKKDAFELKVAFLGLCEYAEVHFAREEKLMDAVAYPERFRHREAHAQLKSELLKFHDGLADPQGPRLAIDKASVFLRDWIVEHVVRMDLPLKPYLTGGRR